MADPRAWALELLGFPLGHRQGLQEGGDDASSASRLREVHPDHGGEHDGAAEEIDKLGEARRILLP